MSTHNIYFHGEKRKILCGYPLLSVAMLLDKAPLHPKEILFLLILNKNICCGYLLEVH